MAIVRQEMNLLGEARSPRLNPRVLLRCCPWQLGRTVPASKFCSSYIFNRRIWRPCRVRLSLAGQVLSTSPGKGVWHGIGRR